MSQYSPDKRAKNINLAKTSTKNALQSIKRAYMPPHEGAPAAFILLTCLIDFLGTLYAGKDSSITTFKKFVSDFMMQKHQGVGYNPTKLRKSLRNKLVHNYSLGDYLLVHNHPELHLTLHGDKNTILNQEDFFEDVQQAVNDYFKQVAQSTDLQEKLSSIISKHGTIEDVEIIINSHSQAPP